MQVTQAMVRRVIPSVNKERLNEFVAACGMWLTHYGINTDKRIAHFLSQCMHESGELKYLEENLNYSADGLRKTFPKYFKTAEDAAAYARKPQQIANRVYANRIGNGNEASGDGWRYRGRGIIQLTGKEQYRNYKNCDFCIGDPVTNPDMIAKFPEAYKSAMWYWEKNRLNEIADTDNGHNTDDVCTKITKVINGGTNGLSQRLYYLRKFKREMGIK